ncbi:MAG: hypothetical protein ACREOH_16855 [Candidatus Entotheonellia bacterium]
MHTTSHSSRSSKAWLYRLLPLIGLLYLGITVRFLPWQPIKDGFHWLATQPSLHDALQDPRTGHIESAGVLLTLVVFIALAAVLAVGLFKVVSTVVEAILSPIWRQLKLSDGGVRWSRNLLNLSLFAIVAAFAYGHWSAWLPYALRPFGLIARACLTLGL